MVGLGTPTALHCRRMVSRSVISRGEGRIQNWGATVEEERNIVGS